MTFNVYTANDAETGGTMTTAEGHRRQNTRFADIASWFDSVTGSDGDKFLKLKSDRSAVEYVNGVSADGVVNLSDVSSLAQGDVLYFNGTNITRLGAGSAGQVLQTNGAGANPSWISVSGAATTVQRSTSTSALSFVPANTVNVIDPSAGSITHYLPDSPTSTQKLIKFLVDGVNSWEANNWTLNGNGNNIIVVNADGSVEAAAATVTISSNISFGVWFNGTQYVMERGI